MSIHPRRSVALAASMLGLALLASAGTPVAAAPPSDPSLRLVAPVDHITVERFKHQPAFIDPGVLVAATHGAWEVRAWRPDYDRPVQAVRVIHGPGGGIQTKALPAGLVTDLQGLHKFLHVRITDADGHVVLARSIRFCPDGQDERLDGSGPTNPTYPRLCFFRSEFTKGTVWGIDRGWAVSAFGYAGIQVKAQDGHYHLVVSITHAWVKALGIDPRHASVDLTMHIHTGDGGGCRDICPKPGAAAVAADSGLPGRPLRAPLQAAPDPAALPDLVALPAWGIETDHIRHHDYLDFSASIWNAGPSPLLVEGYRRDGTDVMDGWQYFMKDGTVVGRARVGKLHYDKRPGHQHWHFEQFARYTLLDATHSQVVLSEKEAFCLAPTDPIDMTVAGADWQPGSTGLSTACGDRASIWTREVLPAGWADTYVQTLPGQSFDITDLPNGTYYIRISTNPTGALFERSMSNNVELRKVTLGGSAGSRTVLAAPWHGIDP